MRSRAGEQHRARLASKGISQQMDSKISSLQSSICRNKQTYKQINTHKFIYILNYRYKHIKTCLYNYLIIYLSIYLQIYSYI